MRAETETFPVSPPPTLDPPPLFSKLMFVVCQGVVSLTREGIKGQICPDLLFRLTTKQQFSLYISVLII